MAHRIRFTIRTSDTVLNTSQVFDLIELLYRWGDSNFNIVFESKHKRWRGLSEWNELRKEHTVTLFVENIKQDYKLSHTIACSQKAPSLNAAVAMVLAHELQHCNQRRMHMQSNKTSFYGGSKYWNLPAEREARGFVDEKLNEICAYFNLEPVMRRATIKVRTDDKELKAVIKLLSECNDVTIDDINDELRASGMLSPSNFAIIRHGLIKKGIQVHKRA